MLSWALSAVSRPDSHSKRPSSSAQLSSTNSHPQAHAHTNGKHAEPFRTSGADEPGLSSIFNAAALYEQIIEASPECYQHIPSARYFPHSKHSKHLKDEEHEELGGIAEDGTTQSQASGSQLHDTAQNQPDTIRGPSTRNLGTEGTTATGTATARARGRKDSLRGFADLVGRDLTPHERALSGRIAQISVSNWARAGEGMLDPEMEGEMEGESDEVDGDESDVFESSESREVSEEGLGEGREGQDHSAGERQEQEKGKGQESQSEGQDGNTPLPPPERPDETFTPSDADEEKLTPEEVVRLLVEEFGPLAEEGEERLVLETDAALVRDVVVLVRFSLFASC